jgi:single-strand DNA-binding protein
MVNKVILVGNLGRDPEMRQTQGGLPVANFSIATSRRSKNADGSRKEETEWHNIVCFGRQAEIAGQYLTKGKQIFLEGRIQTRSWEDKEDRTKKHYKTEIICENFQMLGSKGDGGGGGGRSYGAAAETTGASAPAGDGEYNDDDIPF